MRSIWLRTFFTGIVAIAIVVNFSSSVFAGSCLSCPAVYESCALSCGGRPLRRAGCPATCKDVLRLCHVRCSCPSWSNKFCWGVARSYDCGCR
jgi:hypothetical protein